MRLLALVLPLLVGPPADAGPGHWRWQSNWALREHFDLSLAKAAEPTGFEKELRIERSAPGFPAALRGASLRVAEGGVLLLPTRGEPELLVESRSGRKVLGLRLGGRGLLLLVEEPLLGGEPRALELRYRPAHEYPFRIGHPPRVRSDEDERAHAVMSRAGCFSCHSLHGRRQVGPSLDRESLLPRLAERLGSADYRERIASLDASKAPAVSRWREARSEVLQAEGRARLRRWMYWHLVEPKFDHPQARMPSMGLSPEEIAAVGDYLLGEEAD